MAPARSSWRDHARRAGAWVHGNAIAFGENAAMNRIAWRPRYSPPASLSLAAREVPGVEFLGRPTVAVGDPRAEVGRATWTLLHTIGAQWPEHPTRRQRRDAKALVDVLTRIYPCGECAAEFRRLVRKRPVDPSSGPSMRLSLCELHNDVNARLGKPRFNCRYVGSRWMALPCKEGDGEVGCALDGPA